MRSMYFTTLRPDCIKRLTKNEERFADALNVISQQGQTTTPGTPCPTLCDVSVWVLKHPLQTITVMMQEKGPTVYRLYPRRLGCLTIFE